ncbi:4Fe-4S dicluster domain-containing protein [Saccharicrinis sp. FJH54]|uniref:4Fe-4S dicluster domain-containing protein n=1 Tax=Saccharicrinis sp. FJH54 TaxID=3344665 RepID=UPI0035D50F40
MSDKPNNNPTGPVRDSRESRREFVKKFGIAGAALTVGAAAIYTGHKFEQEKEYVTVLTEDNKLVNVPKDQMKDIKLDLDELQARGREGLEGKSWVMVIDLAKCRNARKCINACQTAHELRPYEYHINTLVMQEDESTEPYFMPKPCQHCDNPPCTAVCPVNATFKRQDGIVLIDNERCIGCRFCMAACPYSARIFHWNAPLKSDEYKQNREEYEEAVERGDFEKAKALKKKVEYNVELNVPQKKGTITKCLFSADRLREGKMPYCVSACPNGVFWYGDKNEDAVTNGTTKETVRFSQLIEEKGGYRLMPELGTEPRVYYLPPKERAFKFPDEKPPKDSYTNEA